MARVKLVTIRNIMGIEEMEFRPGKVTRIEGANETGKTSALEAMKAIVKGGHDATLLRKGAEEGEVVVVLEDLTESGEPGPHDGVEIRKRVTQEKSDLRVKHPDMGTISASKTYVERLIDETAFNPARFVARSDGRVETLLEALDAEVTADQLREAAFADEAVTREVHDDVDRIVREAAERPALEAIEGVRSTIYDLRTGVNRVLRDKATTASELRETLPAEGAEPEEIEAEVEEAEEELEAERTEAHRKQQEAHEEHDERVAEIHADRDEELERLRAEIERVKNEAADAVEESRERKEARIEEIAETYGDEIDRWQERVVALRERLKAVEDAERTRQMIDRAETRAEEAERQSEAMTAAIERLDALKGDVLSDLPIEGADVRDGELYVDDVHFDRLNSAKKAEIAVRIAEMRAGDLGLCVVDDLELLDTEHFEALVERLRESPLQAVVTRVTDDAMTIESEDGGDAGS